MLRRYCDNKFITKTRRTRSARTNSVQRAASCIFVNLRAFVMRSAGEISARSRPRDRSCRASGIRDRETRCPRRTAAVAYRPEFRFRNSPHTPIQRVGRIHAADHLAERHEPLPVLRVREIRKGDVDLRRTAVRLRERERHRAADVRVPFRVVRNRSRAPERCDFRIAVDPELRPASLDHAEEASCRRSSQHARDGRSGPRRAAPNPDGLRSGLAPGSSPASPE